MKKFFLILALFMADLVCLDLVFHGFNYPQFPGESYACLFSALLILYLFVDYAIKIVMYQPKPKEGPKP